MLDVASGVVVRKISCMFAAFTGSSTLCVDCGRGGLRFSLFPQKSSSKPRSRAHAPSSRQRNVFKPCANPPADPNINGLPVQPPTKPTTHRANRFSVAVRGLAPAADESGFSSVGRPSNC